MLFLKKKNWGRKEKMEEGITRLSNRTVTKKVKVQAANHDGTKKHVLTPSFCSKSNDIRNCKSFFW